MPDNTDRKRAEEIAQEAFVLARGAIRQTTIMRKQGGSDEEIALLCDLLREFDALVKHELSEHLSPRIVAFASEVRKEQREKDAKVCDTLKGEGDKPTDRLIGYEECADAIRNEVEPK